MVLYLELNGDKIRLETDEFEETVDGKKVEEPTWMSIIEKFINVLNGLGFSVNEDKVGEYFKKGE